MNQVRIIGGQWRRRLLRFPDSEGLRPTPDRVRETLFNWLGQDLTGLRCLDLFAGSGALGFEAVSRSAAKVVMVDCSAKVVCALRKNIAMLEASDKMEVIMMDALEYALSYEPSKQERFDVAFLDPPYRQDLLARISPRLANLLKPDAAIYAEAEFPVAGLGNWRVTRRHKSGQVHFHLLRQETST